MKVCCLLRDCGLQIVEEDVEQLLSVEMFGRYQQFLLLTRLREDKNCRWCPNPQCAHPIIGNLYEPKLTCTECGTEFCFHCSQKVLIFLILSIFKF